MERDIIDLTGTTYRLAPVPLSCSIIELDDSFVADPVIHQNNTSTPRNARHSIEIRDADSPALIITRPKPVRKRKRQRTPEVQQVTRESIRERSPLRKNFGDCPICFDYIGKNPLASTRCGHVYCLKCLEQSLKVEKRCPTCRKPVKGPTGYHPLYLSPN